MDVTGFRIYPLSRQPVTRRREALAPTQQQSWEFCGEGGACTLKSPHTYSAHLEASSLGTEGVSLHTRTPLKTLNRFIAFNVLLNPLSTWLLCGTTGANQSFSFLGQLLFFQNELAYL